METAYIVTGTILAAIAAYILCVILRTIWRVLIVITAPIRWLFQGIAWALGWRLRRGRRAYIGQDIKARVFAKHGANCVNCGSKERIELDHIIPLARGGQDIETNLIPVCRGCNARKGAC